MLSVLCHYMSTQNGIENFEAVSPLSLVPCLLSEKNEIRESANVGLAQFLQLQASSDHGALRCASTFTPERLKLELLVGWQVNKNNSPVCSTSILHRRQMGCYKLHRFVTSP